MDKEIIHEIPPAINPEITQDFAKYIQLKSEQGSYRVDVKIGDQTIPIDVFPTVFPPKSDYSVSSRSVYEAFGDVHDLEVADIGCGSGIESIVATLAGAKHVDAADINPQAVACTKHNSEKNGVSGSINTFRSDILAQFPTKKYDLIIANLPIVDHQVENNPVNLALYDAGFAIHKRFFEQAPRYLAENGIITFTHANLQSAYSDNPDYDFEVLELLIDKYGYKIVEKQKKNELGYSWVNYKISSQPYLRPRLERGG